MTTAFIDVDDTLILYGASLPNPYGFIDGKPYKPNEKLIEKLNQFKGAIVVWSGGGRDYAREVAMAVLPKTVRYEVQTKWIDDNLQAGDIIVDDQPEYFEALRDRGILVFNPFEEWE